MGIYHWLSLYILSFVAAVLLLAAGSRVSNGPLRLLFFLHVAGTAATLIRLGVSLQAGYAAALVILSGTILSGLTLRATVPLYPKLSFALFLLSAAFFVWSPSRFGGFLETGRLHVSNPDKFRLYQNVCLEAQRGSTAMPGSPQRYKVIREFGLFHKTLRRDIDLPFPPDSVRCLPGSGDDNLVMRAYRSAGGAAGSHTDSVDLTVSLTPSDSLLIRRR